MKKIKISSKVEELLKIEKLVDEISEKTNINSDIYANILVGVTEAVNNSIVHGNKLDKSKFVDIQYSISDKFVQFIITDEGQGFDYHKVPDPTLPENIELEEGRGIFLMNCLADEVIFNDKGNEVSLKFFLA